MTGGMVEKEFKKEKKACGLAQIESTQLRQGRHLFKIYNK